MKNKPLSHAKPLPSCPYFMVNITFGAVCCCMYNHSLDTGINPPHLPFKVLETSIERPPHKKVTKLVQQFIGLFYYYLLQNNHRSIFGDPHFIS